MKLLKRITAVMAALLIVVNITAVNIFAVSSAPVAAEELAEILLALAAAAGHSQSELNGMGVTQMQSLVTNDLRSGKITLDTPIVDPVSGASMSFFQFMNSPENTAARAIITLAFNNFIDDILNPSDNSFGGVDHGGGSSSGVRDYFTPTLKFDDYGTGATVYTSTRSYDRIMYCDHVVINPDGTYSVYGPYKYVDYWKDSTGKYNGVVNWNSGEGDFFIEGIVNRIKFKDNDFYGDVRYWDGTEAPTENKYQYVLGEADGTKVTDDMLNPDGTVTINGVTYYPADYLDPDKLTEEGKKQIINNITNVINNTYVKTEEEPIVDVDDVTIEVAEEFQDYAVPVGIANVFPFCIPWDIVRGFQLLNRPSVVPRFEIPFNIPAFGLFPGVKKSIVLDFSEYDTYIQIFRWFQLLGFSFLLCKLSMTQVKGAGA